LEVCKKYQNPSNGHSYSFAFVCNGGEQGSIVSSCAVSLCATKHKTHKSLVWRGNEIRSFPLVGQRSDRLPFRIRQRLTYSGKDSRFMRVTVLLRHNVGTIRINCKARFWHSHFVIVANKLCLTCCRAQVYLSRGTAGLSSVGIKDIVRKTSD
jgi:hypothetical protein